MLQSLYNRLLHDLKLLGIKFTFTLELKPYSKSYYGRYNPNTNKITLYVYEDKECTKLYSYNKLLDTLIHEFTHYVQYNNPKFTRFKGVMHDKNFVVLFNYYRQRIYHILFWREVRSIEKSDKIQSMAKCV